MPLQGRFAIRYYIEHFPEGYDSKSYRVLGPYWSLWISRIVSQFLFLRDPSCKVHITGVKEYFMSRQEIATVLESQGYNITFGTIAEEYIQTWNKLVDPFMILVTRTGRNQSINGQTLAVDVYSLEILPIQRISVEYRSVSLHNVPKFVLSTLGLCKLECVLLNTIETMMSEMENFNA